MKFSSSPITQHYITYWNSVGFINDNKLNDQLEKIVKV